MIRLLVTEALIIITNFSDILTIFNDFYEFFRNLPPSVSLVSIQYENIKPFDARKHYRAVGLSSYVVRAARTCPKKSDRTFLAHVQKK